MFWKKKSKEPYIGEIYAGYFQGMAICGLCSLDTVYGGGQRVWKDFYKIRESDITDRVGDKIKIDGQWFNEDQMFRYNDIYASLKKKILNKYNKENN